MPGPEHVAERPELHLVAARLPGGAGDGSAVVAVRLHDLPVTGSVARLRADRSPGSRSRAVRRRPGAGSPSGPTSEMTAQIAAEGAVLDELQLERRRAAAEIMSALSGAVVKESPSGSASRMSRGRGSRRSARRSRRRRSTAAFGTSVCVGTETAAG